MHIVISSICRQHPIQIKRNENNEILTRSSGCIFWREGSWHPCTCILICTLTTPQASSSFSRDQSEPDGDVFSRKSYITLSFPYLSLSWSKGLYWRRLLPVLLRHRVSGEPKHSKCKNSMTHCLPIANVIIKNDLLASDSLVPGKTQQPITRDLRM